MQGSVIELFNQSKYPIYEGKFWNVILSRNQQYLGRCIVYLKSRGIADALALTQEEHAELWDDILPRLTRAIKSTFSPDRLNYAHLANGDKQVHWHVVPRYDSEREFLGQVFIDPHPNKTFTSGKMDLSLAMLDSIYEQIRKNY